MYSLFRDANGIFRLGDALDRMFLERFENFFNGFFELRVSSFCHERGIVHHSDVRVHAMTLDDPFAFSAVDAEGRGSDASVIHEQWTAGDADQTGEDPGPAGGGGDVVAPRFHGIKV